MKYLVLICIITTISCANKNKSGDGLLIKKKDKIISLTKKSDTLFIQTINGVRSTLLFDTDTFSFNVSPDSNAVIINSRKLSNLKVSEFYLLGENGKLDVKNKTNLSELIWKHIILKYNIEEDAILFPSTIATFSNLIKDEIVISAKAETELGVIISDSLKIKTRFY